MFENGSDAFDAWSMYRGGFRIDVDKTNNNLFTFQGDAYSGQENEVYMVPTAMFPRGSSVAQYQSTTWLA